MRTKHSVNSRVYCYINGTMTTDWCILPDTKHKPQKYKGHKHEDTLGSKLRRYIAGLIK